MSTPSNSGRIKQTSQKLVRQLLRQSEAAIAAYEADAERLQQQIEKEREHQAYLRRWLGLPTTEENLPLAKLTLMQAAEVTLRSSGPLEIADWSRKIFEGGYRGDAGITEERLRRNLASRLVHAPQKASIPFMRLADGKWTFKAAGGKPPVTSVNTASRD